MDKLSITELIDTQYKEYSRYVCFNRAIPSLIDGFKPSQRKAFYCLKGKGSKTKVMALAGEMISRCLHKDTLISLANGKFITIEDFYMVYKDYTILVKSFDCENNIDAVGEAFNPQITKYTNEFIEIELESNDIFKCTPDHLILTEDGWKEAKDLNESDIIIHL